MQNRVFANNKTNVIWNTEVTGVSLVQKRQASKASICNILTGETSNFPTQGVFIAIGHKPNTDLFKGVLDMDDVGYLITEGKTMKTNVEGVFACGDAQD